MELDETAAREQAEGQGRDEIPASTCKHPVSRVYAWTARDEYGRPVLCAGCCECGEVLAGAAGYPCGGDQE